MQWETRLRLIGMSACFDSIWKGIQERNRPAIHQHERVVQSRKGSHLMQYQAFIAHDVLEMFGQSRPVVSH